MSRAGKYPVEVPSGVTVTINKNDVAVKGAKGQLSMPIVPEVKIEMKDNKVWVLPLKKDNRGRSMWGTSQRNLRSMIEGVSKGYTVKLEIQGVGFRAASDKQFLTLALGYSHDIKYAIPVGIEVKCEKPTLVAITGFDKRLVGQVAAEIRELRKPEPYKGKGVRYEGEYVRHKEGKKK